MSFQMQVPRQAEESAAAPRRRRRVKKSVPAGSGILQQPNTLSETVLGIPAGILNSFPMEKPPKNMSVSRSVVDVTSEEEDFITIFHIIPDPRLIIERVKILGRTEGAAGISVVDMETDEEIVADTLMSEEMTVLELSGFPEEFSNTLVIKANPDGTELEIVQVEVWAEIKPETD